MRKRERDKWREEKARKSGVTSNEVNKTKGSKQVGDVVEPINEASLQSPFGKVYGDPIKIKTFGKLMSSSFM